MEQRVQQVNTSQTEQSICLYNKANMKPLFLGLREHTEAGHWATRELGRLQQGERFRIQRTFSKQNTDLGVFCSEMSNQQTNRAVQTQHNDHEEEDDGKESSSRHICYGFCINDEQQTGTWRGKNKEG